VPLVAIVDLVGTLSSSRRLKRDQMVAALDLLLRGKEIVVDRADLVLQARQCSAKGSASFADCLIVRTAQVHGCQATMTFDARAAKAAGMTLAA
jgi:predicted nucleic-acid-binding protein